MNPPKHIVSAAAVVLNERNEILLIKGPRRGWEIPGGQVEDGESPAQAAVRETLEESGVEIEIIRFCGIYHNIKGCICNTLFLSRPIGGQPTVTVESLETGYFPIEEALQMVTWMNFRERIESCIHPDGKPVYVEFNG